MSLPSMPQQRHETVLRWGMPISCNRARERPLLEDEDDFASFDLFAPPPPGASPAAFAVIPGSAGRSPVNFPPIVVPPGETSCSSSCSR
eukprot:CAMPEP_0179001548 /NCGR_PEP_ID=MMETSP0795-20121207/11432_1 /TAXON_ID=88552 /ORGANISM="Amoebophrya sp., Strain Ameob2" /LENGTH=88 /DNA_ID=CAMNT_0020694955 /DNA_START=273 /DNA_END=540 /DNA_ORIENTATION=+